MKIRLPLIGVVSAGLLAVSAVGVGAQDLEVPAYTTGTISVPGEGCSDHDQWNECPLTFVAADPRLSATGVIRNQGQPMPFSAGDGGLVIPVTSVIHVANDEGAWTGGGSLFAVVSESGPADGADEPTWILAGEGAYEGLTAMVRVDFPEAFAAVILEGEVPPAPPVPGQ
jgi:hypothetical protein